MEMLRQLQADLPPFAFGVFRLCAWLALLMVVFVPLEKVCALHRQKVFRKAFATDLAYYFLSSLLPKILLIMPMRCVAQASIVMGIMRRIFGSRLLRK